jgi:hypothetical protein
LTLSGRPMANMQDSTCSTHTNGRQAAAAGGGKEGNRKQQQQQQQQQQVSPQQQYLGHANRTSIEGRTRRAHARRCCLRLLLQLLASLPCWPNLTLSPLPPPHPPRHTHTPQQHMSATLLAAYPSHGPSAPTGAPVGPPSPPTLHFQAPAPPPPSPPLSRPPHTPCLRHTHTHTHTHSHTHTHPPFASAPAAALWCPRRARSWRAGRSAAHWRAWS